MQPLTQQLRQFVVDNFLFGQDNGFAENTSFLDHGMIDSTGMLELLSYLEKTFAITVEDAELVPENLDSIDNLVAFIKRKQRAAGQGGTASAS